ncbi:hypothetical protein AGMMS49957_10650 [Synergistales bacterium]|nr:hypothetical protein AGMMS49957_10650 [Synergistales bacterium]
MTLLAYLRNLKQCRADAEPVSQFEKREVEALHEEVFREITGDEVWNLLAHFIYFFRVQKAYLPMSKTKMSVALHTHILDKKGFADIDLSGSFNGGLANR